MDLIKPYGFCSGHADLWSCVKFEVAVTGASSGIVLYYGLFGRIATLNIIPQSTGAVVKFEMAVPNCPLYCLCGRKATLNLQWTLSIFDSFPLVGHLPPRYSQPTLRGVTLISRTHSRSTNTLTLWPAAVACRSCLKRPLQSQTAREMQV